MTKDAKQSVLFTQVTFSSGLQGPTWDEPFVRTGSMMQIQGSFIAPGTI
jgi:hypothetical protein